MLSNYTWITSETAWENAKGKFIYDVNVRKKFGDMEKGMHYMVCLKRKKGDMIVLWQVYISKVPNIVTPSDSASLRLKSLYRINSSNTITEWTNKETTFNFIGGEQASGDKVFFAPSCDIFHTTISHLHPV